MLVIAGLSVLLMVVLYAEHAFAPTSVFLGLWVLSPVLMRWLGRPGPLLRRNRIDVEDKHFLRRLARRTWRYFDDLVDAGTNWLPPGQFATRAARRSRAANFAHQHRTLADLRAGGARTSVISRSTDFVSRCAQTMATLDRLEHYEGHLLNWYNTKTLEPLTPRYVSTVDSGNLVASLWVFERGCEDLLNAPLLGQTCLRGIADTLGVLREEAGRDTVDGDTGPDASALVARQGGGP